MTSRLFPFSTSLILPRNMNKSDAGGTSAAKLIKVFYAYSHKDETLRDQLETHLSILKRREIISSWHDRRISAGTEWESTISEHLDSADIILLLISSDFIASDYCYGKEMRRALERHELGEARVIPVVLRPCDMDGAPFYKLQGLPKDMKPVTRWIDQDEAFTDVAIGIRKVAEELRSNSPRLSVLREIVSHLETGPTIVHRHKSPRRDPYGLPLWGQG